VIRGRVVGLQIRADVIFRLPNQPDMAIEFVIDTGFEGALTLPPAAIATLGLPLLTDIHAKLADKSRRKVNAHLATILWV
jgi:clan AA aspartic protease